jgi:hypothetical protein
MGSTYSPTGNKKEEIKEKEEREIMSTRRFTLDSRGRKMYINDYVLYENKVYYIEDIKYLNWSNDQYITLVDSKNKNKKIDFISPNDIRPIRKRTKR